MKLDSIRTQNRRGRHSRHDTRRNERATHAHGRPYGRLHQKRRHARARAHLRGVRVGSSSAESRELPDEPRMVATLHVPTERDTGLCSTRLPGHFARRCAASQASPAAARPCCEWISCPSISAGQGHPRRACYYRLARLTTIRRRKSSGGIGGRCSSNEGWPVSATR